MDQIGCVLMAAGEAKRFGSNKLLADFGGAPLFARTLAATASFERRVVVTRWPAVAALCEREGVPVVLHPAPARDAVVRLGLDALTEGGALDGCLFCPCDQPFLSPATLKRLTAAFRAAPDCIFRPACGSEVGSPVLFPASCFAALRVLPPGRGGSVLLKQHPELVRTVPVQSRLELLDADTPETLETLRSYL